MVEVAKCQRRPDLPFNGPDIRLRKRCSANTHSHQFEIGRRKREYLGARSAGAQWSGRHERHLISNFSRNSPTISLFIRPMNEMISMS